MTNKVMLTATMAELTLAAVIERIAGDVAIPPQRRRGTVTLLRAGARFLGKAPEQLPFDTALLAKLAKVAPRRHQVGKGHLQNVRTAYRFALAHQGIEFVRGRDDSPPSAAWQALLAMLADSPRRSTVARATRWFTRKAIEPTTVTLADIEAFRAALIAGDVRGAAKATWWRLVNGWTEAMATVPEWPRVEIQVERWPDRWTLRIADMPAPLRAEIESFLAWARGEDERTRRLGVFAGRKRRKARRPATVDGYVKQLRAYVTAAINAGIGPDRLNSLPALLEEDVIEAAIRHLDERAGGSSDDRAHRILSLLKVIGQDFLKLEGPVMRLIAEECRELRPEQTGMHPKNIERLAPLLADSRLRHRFYDLPERLMRRAVALDEVKGGRQPAVLAQLAVALELWPTVPLRIGNMAGLELDRHLARLAIRDGHAMIVIPGEEMKSGRPRTWPVMKRSCPRIHSYLERFHARLEGPGNSWLFPGKKGRHKVAGGLGEQISKLIRDELGLDFHPHLFRHLAGELYLTAYEGDFEGVANLLGHEGTATARLYYTTPRVRAAVERLDTVVLRLGAKLPAPAANKKRGR